MTTQIKTTISWDNAEAFRKFVRKIQRNVSELKVEIGEKYEKVFRHYELFNGTCTGNFKAWHEVCDVTIEMPEDSGWRLLATFENGDMFITDNSKEIIFKNPTHGKDCFKCDLCGHRCFKSYLVYNEQTGEELQVGSECAKKFGLKYMDWLSQFSRELYRNFDLGISTSDFNDLDCPCWPDDSQKYLYRAIEVPELICAAKARYDENPVWDKGYYEGRTYIKSSAMLDIQRRIGSKEYMHDTEYACKVCEYIKAHIKPESDFSEEMLNLANGFYASPADAAKGFFMVKAYEDYLKELSADYIKIDAGMQVKVTGKIIQIETYEGFYGSTNVYKILTPKGYTVVRKGTIPVFHKDEDYSQYTEFYALVENNSRGIITAGRATKHPKKGINVIEL